METKTPSGITPTAADKKLARQRAAAVSVIGIMLAVAIYYGETAVRSHKENAEEVHVPVRGLEYYRPLQDKASEIKRLTDLLRRGEGGTAEVEALVDAYDAGKILKAGADFFTTASKKQSTNPAFPYGLGLIALNIHDYKAADRNFTQALSLKADSLPIMKGLATARIYEQKPDQATVILEKAITLAQGSNDPILGDLKGNLAACHLVRGSLKSALDLQLEAIALHESAGNAKGSAIDYFSLARIKLAMRLAGDAKEAGAQAIEAAQSAGDKVLELRCYALMVLICQQEQDKAEFNIYLAKGKQLGSELGIPEDLVFETGKGS